MGGFECATHRRHDGKRLDLVASTRHDQLASEDYATLAAHGMLGARDGVRWHLVETVPGHYDWSSVLPQMRAARQAGVRVAWDLAHYGYPDFIDPWSDDFVEALARYAAAFARLALEEEGQPPILCPVNEISFWAWGGGEVGHFNPMAKGRGGELKRQFIRAALHAGRAARAAVPGTRIIAVDPLIRVVPRRPEEADAAEGYAASQWQGWDALLGQYWPELGGGPDGFDVMGVNYYWNNQWELDGERIEAGDPRYLPFRELLADAWNRYRRPIFLAETSIEGPPRAAWLRYVCAEIRAALQAGVPVGGICLYPVVSHLGWDDDRYCPNGLFELEAVQGRRPCHGPLGLELQRQRALFEAQARGTAIPEDPDALALLIEALREAEEEGRGVRQAKAIRRA
ncbi:MAG TPA: beta-glucosidase [Roseomonas sp.]